MDLEPLPPNPDEFWTSPGVTETDAGLTAPRRRWSTRARVAAACSAVGIAGVAGFGFTEIATGGGVPAFGSLLAASSGSGSSPSTAPATKTLRGAAFGTVSNLSGPNFTVTNTRRATTSTTNVVTDTNTGFTKTFKGAVSDIKTGQTIAARGARNADGSIAASDIVVLPDGALAGKAPASPPPAPSGPAPAGPRPEMRMRGGGGVGTVKSVSSGVITITTLRGDTQTIDTTASTTVIETVKAALSDVTNGATVAVVGTPASDNSHLTATRVAIIDPSLVGKGGVFGFGGFGGRAGGFFVGPFPGGRGGKHLGGGPNEKIAPPASSPTTAS